MIQVIPRLLVTGSRTWTDEVVINHALAKFWIVDADQDPLTTLVHGACPRGVDKIAARIWSGQGLIQEPYPADWGKHGKAAGFIRNKEMVDSKPTACYAFIYNKSHGATHCADYAESQGIPTYRWTIDD